MKNNSSDLEHNLKSLTKEQRLAFDSITSNIEESITNGDIFNDSSITGLNGQAGSGKTYLSKTLVQYFLNKGYSIVVVAPTHQAVNVIRDSIGIHNDKLVFGTLHSFLGIRPGTINPVTGEIKFVKAKEDKDLNGISSKNFDICFLDESSMVGYETYNFLETKLNDNKVKSICFLGDECQLLPVEEKRNKSKVYIHKIYDNPVINHCTLTKIIRNPDNEVIDFVTKIRDFIIENKEIYRYNNTLSLYETLKELSTGENSIGHILTSNDLEHINLVKQYKLNYQTSQKDIDKKLKALEKNLLKKPKRTQPYTKGDLFRYIIDESKKEHNKIHFYRDKKEFWNEYTKVSKAGCTDDIIATFTNQKVDEYNTKARNTFLNNYDTNIDIHPIDLFVVQQNTYEGKGKYKPKCTSSAFMNSEVIQVKESIFSTTKYKGLEFNSYECTTTDERQFTKLASSDEEKYNKYKELLRANALKTKNYRDWEIFYEYSGLFFEVKYHYCSTTHKLQGSSYVNAYIDFTNLNYVEDDELLRLFYVACTRAKEHVHILI
jgi:ATP-dependent exoDNAse (exonuclease V) alpha subunit